MRRTGLWLLATLSGSLLLSCCADAGSSGASTAEPRPDIGLISPFPHHAYKGKSVRTTECPAPLPAQRDLLFESVYLDGDKSASIVDPEDQDVYKEATRPIRRYESALLPMANAWAAGAPDGDAQARCALKWLDHWAKNKALLGKVNRQGQAVRKWTLASVASAYAQIRGNGGLHPRSRARVEGWLIRVAHKVQEDYSRDPDSASRNNNHLYWAAWSVSITGIAVQDRDMLDWGLEQARRGLGQVQSDGTLPREMVRKGRALHYHAFATGPLVMLAETARANGKDLYSENGRALARLARRVLGSLDDSSYFQAKTGTLQDVASMNNSSALAWVIPYYVRTKDPLARRQLGRPSSLAFPRMGGDLSLLFNICPNGRSCR